MKIFTTRAVIASGQALNANSVYEVSEKDAAILIGMGKAREATTEDNAPACPPKPKAKSKPKPKKPKIENGTE